MERYDEIKMGEKGAWVSIVAYLGLAAAKIIVGVVARSQALIADGVNNTTDVVASVAVLIGLKVSRKPPDEDHPYGHFRAETIASLIASFIMAAAGLQVLLRAAGSLFAETVAPPDLAAAWTALFCALVMFLVYRFNLKLGEKINSQAVRAAAKDNRSDALVSVGAAIGIFGSQYGLPWLDPLAATVVGILIVKTGWDIFWEASHHLTDGFDQERLADLRRTVESTAGVDGVKDIKARVHGNSLFVDVVVLVDPRLSVVESHDIAEQIEKKLMRTHEIINVHVHIEPAEPGR